MSIVKRVSLISDPLSPRKNQQIKERDFVRQRRREMKRRKQIGKVKGENENMCFSR